MYFPEELRTQFYDIIEALLDGENHFCYLVPNLSYKGGSLFQLNLDRLYNIHVYFNGRACNKVVKY